MNLRAFLDALEAKAPDQFRRVAEVIDPDYELPALVLELERRFADRVFFHRIFVPQAQVEVLEIFDPAVNKWEGILHVARHHGVEPEQIIAIGDDVNDLPMLRQAGLGVAMGNARDEIKSAANSIAFEIDVPVSQGGESKPGVIGVAASCAAKSFASSPLDRIVHGTVTA